VDAPCSRPGNGSEAAWGQGELSLSYNELRALARQVLRRHRSNRGPRTTSLVHDAFIRLAKGAAFEPESQSHLMATVARAMRFTLVDHFRHSHTAKRKEPSPDGVEPRPLNGPARPEADLLVLDEALDRLAVLDPRKARLVELRFFAAMTIQETARALHASPATVKREWAIARAWLYRELTQ